MQSPILAQTYTPVLRGANPTSPLSLTLTVLQLTQLLCEVSSIIANAVHDVSHHTLAADTITTARLTYLPASFLQGALIILQA